MSPRTPATPRPGIVRAGTSSGPVRGWRRAAAVVLSIMALCVALASNLGLGAPSAAAAGLELRLAGLDPAGDAEAFENVVRDLGLATLPAYQGGAASPGGRGFAVGYTLNLTFVDPDGHWAQAVPTPSDTLASSQFTVRKGLPYSFHVGGHVSTLHDSGTTTVAVELGWAFVDGFAVAPDIAIRLTGATLLGSRDLSLITGSVDVLLSKTFGAGGLVQITPFVGGNATIVYGSSHVLGGFDPGALEPETFLLPDVVLAVPRARLGLRVDASVASLGVEGSFGSDVQSVAFNAGLVF